ncbi:MAG TPA: TonB-dependent receptor, partial [Gemmatimonadales bacterium]|nr:TonB-dependent receptor [Gemmatimonadales bacterium]
MPGANVFVLETLEGGLTGHAGRFSFTVARAGPVTVVVRRIGFVELRRAVTLPLTDSLVLELVPQAVELDPLTVEAGRVLAPADEPDVALTSLGVVTTPGTAADVYRAIQTFPGLQAVDEGAGLFVRGGDVAETRIYLNDALVLSPYRYESPTGGFFGAFDPFLLDGIAFSTGGFGARYGDALSAVADLETQGRPEALSGGATASLAAVSATMGLPLPSGLGARGTGTRSNTRLMFDVNGSTTEFSQVPEGRDLSGSLHWRYPGGEVKAFGMDQWSRVGVTVDDEAFSGTFNGEEVHRFSVITWRDTVSSAITSLSASVAYSGRSQSFGAFQLEERKRAAQLRGRAAVPLGNPFRLTAGGELEARRSSFAGSVPESADDNRPTARRTLFDAAVDGARHAEFVEGDWLRGATRVTGGLRTDWSELTGRRSWDPRLAGAWRVAPGATLTAAWGIYHQVPDPFFYEPTTGTPNLGPMRATHWVGGIQVEGLGLLLRGEGYVKTYRNLAQRTRDFGVVAGGQGVSRGMDWFLRWQGRPGLDLRLADSLIHARRTDPDAGVQA